MDPHRPWWTSRSLLLGVWALLLTCLGVVLFKSQPPVRVAPPTRPAEARDCIHASRRSDKGLLGVVMPQQAVEVRAQVEGRLERLLVKEGEHVRAGAVLAVLALKEMQNQEAVAAAALATARAEEQRAQLVAEEKRDWLSRSEQPTAGVLSAREVEEARYGHKTALADLETARTRVQQRQAELTLLRTRLSEGQLRMPFDGVVTARYLSAGSLVQGGTPILRVIQEASPLVRFAVPEERGGELTVGMPITLSMDEGSEPLRARVDNVSPEVDASSRMIFAMGTLESAPPPTPLAVGKVVRVWIDSPRASAPVGSTDCVW